MNDEGQRVVVAFDIACGSCSYCQREEYTACDTTNPSPVMEALYGHRYDDTTLQHPKREKN